MRENIKDRKGERGSAMVIAILIMGLLSIFVAVALARVTTESLIMGNESDEQSTTYAAQASLETMTRNFNKIFDVHLSPTDDDLTKVRAATPPGFNSFTYSQDIIKKGDSESVTISGGTYQGLKSLQDPWEIRTTATSNSGQQVMLTRDFLNNRIPIFQFGMFFDGDLEVASGSSLSFGGRVHTNGHLYLRGGGDTRFDSRVSASGEVVIDVARNGLANSSALYGTAAGFGENIYIKDSAGTYQQLRLTKGSVLNGPDVNTASPDTEANVPDGSLNPLWRATNTDTNTDWKLIDDIFGGNLVAKAKKLELPLKLGGGASNNIEMIKRGRQTGDFEAATLARTVDNQIMSNSRYSNKPGIRVSLADSQAELPGGTGGVRLDGASVKPTSGAWGSADGDGSRGYKPLNMTDAASYTTTRMNGHRLYTGASYTDNGTGCPTTPGCTANSMPANRESWIKVELVNTNTSTLLPVTDDITEDFLSLGITEKAPDNGVDFKMNANYYAKNQDSRSILKLQRFVIPGTPIRDNAGDNAPYPTVIMEAPKETINEVSNASGDGIYFDWGTGSPNSAKIPYDYYFIRWSGKLKPGHASGSQNYNFYAEANDGMKVWVSSSPITSSTAPIIDNWTNKTSAQEVASSTISLNASTVYYIKVEYYQNKNADGAVAKLKWKIGTGTKVAVPKTKLYSPQSSFYNNLSGGNGNGLIGEYYSHAFSYAATPDLSCVTNKDYLMPNESNLAVGTQKINDDTTYTSVVPFPIQIFDAREGFDNEFLNSNSAYRDTGAIPYAGVMSLIDVDVANLKNFLDGDYDGKFPTTTPYAVAKGALTAASVTKVDGWIMYISDRRGDRSFDGQYDMEDVYGPVYANGSIDATRTGPNDGALQWGEDLNFNGALDTDYSWEATRYRESSVSSDRVVNPTQIVQPTTTTQYRSTNSDLAAIFDHKYYRRSVRVINGSQLPGDKNNGFTLASENGVYIYGNYNATGVSSYATPTSDSAYLPNANNGQVPASIVADAVTILSNAPAAAGGSGWTDGTSFRKPDDSDFRLARETTVRAALLMGNSISGMYDATINQGGANSQNLNGMVSNFKRFLERWNNTYFNYCGSLINLYNSQNHVGTFKYGGGTVYTAPTRNWVFDGSFTDPTRLPPGTPFFQYVQMTGFRRMNN